MDKTIVVSVERLARHRLYKRVIRLTHEVQGARRGQRGPASATPSSSRSRARCRRPSAGGWSSVVARAGEHALPGEVVADEAETSEAIHAAAHPGPDARRGRAMADAARRGEEAAS